MRKKECASCRHSKYLLNCIQRKMAWIWRGFEDYFSSKYATLAWLFWAGGKWESTDAERSLPRASLIWLQAETSGKWECQKSPLLGKFYGYEEDGNMAPRWSCTDKTTPPVPPYTYLLRVQLLSLSLNTSLQVYCSSVKMLYKPTSCNHSFE